MSHFYLFQNGLKQRLALLVCLGLLCSLLLASTRLSLADQQPNNSVSPEEAVRKFYNWYLGARFPEPKRSNMATFRKYVTLKCWKRATARDVESVLFIDAQDVDETWANNFTVSNAKIEGQRATLQVDLNGKEMKRNLNVTLRREGGVWKIDDVKGID